VPVVKPKFTHEVQETLSINVHYDYYVLVSTFASL